MAKVFVVVGHYGSGKTNFAVNLALERSALGEQVVLTDLDVVNPYFRSADFEALLAKRGVSMIKPPYANTNLDLPTVTGELDGALRTDKTVIIDVGGDDAGAIALGRYSQAILETKDHTVYYVVNCFRRMTQTAQEAVSLMHLISGASQLRPTAVVNNSNLGEITTPEDVAQSIPFARETAAALGVPLALTCVREDLAPAVLALLEGENMSPVKLYVRKPWEEPLT